MANGNPFYVDPMPADNSQLMTGLGNIVQQNRDKQEAQAQQQQQQSDIKAAFQSRDPDKIMELSFKYPELSDKIYETAGIRDEQQKSEFLDFSRDVLTSSPDQIPAKYEQRIKQIQARGGDPSKTIESYQDYMANAEGEMNDLRAFMAGAAPEQYKALQSGGGAEANIGAASPKDFTTESMATYAESGNIGDLVRYTPQVKDIAGIPHQYNQSTLQWEPLIDMTDKRISEQAKGAASIEADRQSKLDFTKQQSEWQKNESKMVSKLSSARSKHTILEDTAQQIKDMRSGWSSQYGAALSGLPASEARKMKGLIDTIKANSAFGTLTDLKESGGTLGAISAPELVLLEAALGTLDQYGDNEEQMRVIDQILTANKSSIDRIDNAYIMDRKKYGSSFEEAKKVAEEETSTVNWADM